MDQHRGLAGEDDFAPHCSGDGEDPGFGRSGEGLPSGECFTLLRSGDGDSALDSDEFM